MAYGFNFITSDHRALRSAWATKQVLRQLRLHGETIFLNQNQTYKGLRTDMHSKHIKNKQILHIKTFHNKKGENERLVLS